jgi:hypothetical protein
MVTFLHCFVLQMSTQVPGDQMSDENTELNNARSSPLSKPRMESRVSADRLPYESCFTRDPAVIGRSLPRPSAPPVMRTFQKPQAKMKLPDVFH